MDFSWNDEQRHTYERMQALGSRAAQEPPSERLRLLATGGALGLAIDRTYGGGGLDLVSTAHAYEALGSTLPDGGVLLAAGAHLFGVALVVQQMGTDEQKKRWLPALATGGKLATVAATEADSGSNIGAVQALAEQRGDHFVLNGEKCYVTNAGAADQFLFVGRPNAAARGLTTVLCDAECPGVAVGEPLSTIGLRGAGLAPLAFRDCMAPGGDVLGRPGAGMAVFQAAMTYERALVLAFRLGAMQRALEEATAFARGRRLADRPIADHQAVSHRLARMKLRLETARLLTYRTAWALDRGERAQADAALAKWHLADAALESSTDALLLRGGAGFIESAGLGAELADALGGSIHSGTQDVLPLIVARAL